MIILAFPDTRPCNCKFFVNNKKSIDKQKSFDKI